MKRVPPEEIEAKRSPRGGWTKKQLAEWEVPWPPPKGWRARLEGRGQGKEIEITLKFPGRCSECGCDLIQGETALWTVDGGIRCTGRCGDTIDFTEFD